MSDWTVRRRVIASFALILALMAVMAAVALERLSFVGELGNSLIDDSLPGLHLSSQLIVATLTTYALTQEHVISHDVPTVQQLEGVLKQEEERLNKLLDDYARSMFQSEDRLLFAALRSSLSRFFQAQQKVLALSRTLQNQEASALAGQTLRPEFENVLRAAQALVDYNKSQAGQAASATVGAVRSAALGVVIAGAAALALALVCGILLSRAIGSPLARLLEAVEVLRSGNLSRRVTLQRRDEFAALSDGFNRMCDELGSLVGHIQKSGIQVNTSVTEIAATAKQQQATATEIAATTTEIGATSREITATSRELVNTMRDVAGHAEQSASLATSGQSSLNQMEATMSRIMEATGGINAKLAVLNDKAANIGQVVTTITRVADQTNLLSLNAAIEAEKAGEYGRGFSVVATEIRRLADQTAIATTDIEQMVKEIQSAVSAGVMGMDRFSEEVRGGMREVQQVGAQLTQIIQQVQALAPRCEAVNEGVQAQSTSAEQITQALTQLGEAAQQTVESLRQSTTAIGDLNQVASGLRSAISRFRVEG